MNSKLIVHSKYAINYAKFLNHSKLLPQFYNKGGQYFQHYNSYLIPYHCKSVNNKTNLISIKITKAIFELYTVIMGKKIHIKDIHLEDYLKDPFVFEGPKSFATDMTFTMPDSTVKKIYVMPTQCIMKVIRQAIVTSCEIAASDKPFSMPIKLAPPIQNGNKPKEPSTKK